MSRIRNPVKYLKREHAKEDKRTENKRIERYLTP